MVVVTTYYYVVVRHARCISSCFFCVQHYSGIIAVAQPTVLAVPSWGLLWFAELFENLGVRKKFRPL